jgi:hypothetical protein
MSRATSLIAHRSIASLPNHSPYSVGPLNGVILARYRRPCACFFGSVTLGLRHRSRGIRQGLPCRNLRSQHPHTSAMHVSTLLDPVETRRITTHLGHLRTPILPRRANNRASSLSVIDNLRFAFRASGLRDLLRRVANQAQAPLPQRRDTYFFTSSSSVLASICMSIPAHTSLGDFALG